MPLDLIVDNLELFAWASAVTIGISIAAILGGTVLGVGTATLRMSRVRPFRVLGGCYVELIRNTPSLTLMFLIYFGLPQLGMRLSPGMAVVIALSISNGAYLSEIVRGGLQAVPRGQREAAAAIGLSSQTAFKEILAPQALRSVLPAVVNQFILTILASSVGTILGVPELTHEVLFVDSRTYRTIELLTFLTLMYVGLTYVVSRAGTAAMTRLDRAYLR